MAGKSGRSGGAREGAGRPKRPPVLVTVADTSDPVQFLLAVMNDSANDARLRVDAAKALMPHLHPKKGEGGKKEEAVNAAKKAGAGRFAPSAPPRSATVTNLPGK